MGRPRLTRRVETKMLATTFHFREAVRNNRERQNRLLVVHHKLVILQITVARPCLAVHAVITIRRFAVEVGLVLCGFEDPPTGYAAEDHLALMVTLCEQTDADLVSVSCPP